MPTINEPLSHGEMLTAILLALCPTGIGLALKDSPQSLCEWSNFVANYDDDSAAVGQMQQILTDPRYSDLFTRLIIDPAPALVIQERILHFFQVANPNSDGVGNAASPSRWGDNPPHPKGAEVSALISYLAKLTDPDASDLSKANAKKTSNKSRPKR